MTFFLVKISKSRLDKQKINYRIENILQIQLICIFMITYYYIIKNFMHQFPDQWLSEAISVTTALDRL